MSDYDSLKSHSESVLNLLIERDELEEALKWIVTEINITGILHKEMFGGLEQACDAAETLLDKIGNYK